MYTLFTDTDCDITPEIAERYGYKLISMPYTIEGKQVFPYADFKDFEYKEFYNRLRKGVVPQLARFHQLNISITLNLNLKRGVTSFMSISPRR